jgi:hypothetical protein
MCRSSGSPASGSSLFTLVCRCGHWPCIAKLDDELTGEGLYLIGHDGESAAHFPNAGIDGQQVGLPGDGREEIGNPADLARSGVEMINLRLRAGLLAAQMTRRSNLTLDVA